MQVQWRTKSGARVGVWVVHCLQLCCGAATQLEVLPVFSANNFVALELPCSIPKQQCVCLCMCLCTCVGVYTCLCICCADIDCVAPSAGSVEPVQKMRNWLGHDEAQACCCY